MTRGSHRSSSRLSPREWVVRGALTVVAVVGGYMSVTHALATALRSRAPAQAHRIAPWHARAQAQFAMSTIGANASSGKSGLAEALARSSLRRDATAIPAVVTLGLAAHLRGDLPRARALFAYSDRLSRRDLSTRLWLIEEAVSREQIAEALRHYDLAMRTSRPAIDRLHPVLAAASSDPAIARPLSRMLATNPPYAEGFVGYLAANTKDPVATASLFETLQSLKFAVPEAASAAVIQALVAQRRIDQAWRYYVSIRPSAVRDRSRDAKFSDPISEATAFDWAPVANQSSVSATIVRSERHGMIDFSAPATVGGPVVQQLLLLPTGTYALRGHSVGIDQPQQSSPYWTLACEDGRELGRVVVPSSSQADGRFSGTFVVPTACPAQYLRLVVRPTSTVGGVSGQIDYVALARVD